MLSKTLSSGLQQYQIGPKLRSLRLRKKLGLVELGSHTGLSAAMLSKIERGVLFPTLPTLLRIAMVFNVGLEHFLWKIAVDLRSKLFGSGTGCGYRIGPVLSRRPICSRT